MTGGMLAHEFRATSSRILDTEELTDTDVRITEDAMANKEQRSNREKRKPKKEKPKSAPQVSSFSGTTTKSAAGQKK